MEPNDIRAKLLCLLAAVAPDIDPESVDPERDLRDQFDFDSMDALHFASGVSAAFGIEIPETDYPKLASLRAAGELIEERMAPGR
ncbi:MAG TPA: acyl carrier protein [Steroidobacteraceae bacterium]|nr:acyl carrier protein [Steroidobacteraceae bacterium]